MSRKRASSRALKNNVYELSEALVRNGRAAQEGPRRKNWSRHDLKHIKPLTLVQEEMFRGFFEGNNICAHGSAGTGKTFIAMYLALSELLNQSTPIERIIIVRSVVPTREVGHLPGTLEEKQAVYETPYKDIFAELLGHANSYEDMKAAGLISFQTSSFVRGLTWENAVIVIDEFQNMQMDEFDGVFTRAGENSRVIVCGDNVRQCDLKRNEVPAANNIIKVLNNMDAFDTIQFTVHDIVRGALVKSWIKAREALQL
jgi:phosphate starvation-inducible protein PhoH